MREKFHTYPKEALCVHGSFDSQFVHLIKPTINNLGVQSSAVRNSCSKGNIIDRSKSALAETDKIYIEDITRGREDMNFIFEWQNNILRTSAASE